MAIDEEMAERVRAALAGANKVHELKMFGGLGFLLNGNMVAATSDRGLLLRVGEKAATEAVSRGARPMVMNGRTMKDYVRVTGALGAREVKSWLRFARAFVETLPEKKRSPQPKSKPKTKKTKKTKRRP
jgi:TfoX/Sxy family transcriptional regulator of competence genes